jgi:Tfp pilus assembly protein PilF
MVLVILLLILAACGPEKKKPQMTEAEIQEEYDFRAALQSYKIGINHINNNEVGQGIQHLEHAVKLDDGNYRYRHGLGLAYSLSGQFEKALEQLKTGIRINPQDTESYNLMGSVYTEMQRYSEAEQAFRKVLQDKSYSQPEFAYFNLGLNYRKQNRETEAIAALNRVVQIEPEFYRAYVLLGDIYREREAWDKAYLHYKNAEPGFLNDATVLYQIGHSLFRLRRFDEAKNYLAQVSILFPPPEIDQPTQNMLRYIEKIQRRSSK